MIDEERAWKRVRWIVMGQSCTHTQRPQSYHVQEDYVERQVGIQDMTLFYTVGTYM